MIFKQLICALLLCSIAIQNIAFAAIEEDPEKKICEDNFEILAPQVSKEGSDIIQLLNATPEEKALVVDLKRISAAVNEPVFHESFASYFREERGYTSAEKAQLGWENQQKTLKTTMPDKRHKILLREADKIIADMKKDFRIFKKPDYKSEKRIADTVKKYKMSEGLYNRYAEILNGSEESHKKLLRESIAFKLEHPNEHFAEAVFKAIKEQISAEKKGVKISFTQILAMGVFVAVVGAVANTGAILSQTQAIANTPITAPANPLQSNAVDPAQQEIKYKIDSAIWFGSQGENLEPAQKNDAIYKQLLNLNLHISNKFTMDYASYMYLLDKLPLDTYHLLSDPSEYSMNDPKIIMALEGLQSLSRNSSENLNSSITQDQAAEIRKKLKQILGERYDQALEDGYINRMLKLAQEQ